LGDPSKAKARLGWKLEHSFQDLVREMVANDLGIAKRDAIVAREGFRTYRYSE
jgi:GDPmannose 4,6-dehydratase